jgi:hypothetical protein
VTGPVRKWMEGANVAAAILLAAVVVVLLNVVASRHPLRANWSRSAFYELSEKTDSLLSSVTSRVDVLVFCRPRHDAYADLERLLQEYRYACPSLRVEWIDPDRDFARAEQIVSEFGVEQANLVLVRAGDRVQSVEADDLIEYDSEGVEKGAAPDRAAFRGEALLTSAIHSVLQETAPVVCFVTGHGERDPEDFDVREGYSRIARIIERDNMEIRKADLASGGLPPACDALILAGPTRRLAQPELDLLAEVLESSGRVMLLVDAGVDTGLNSVLDDWGLRLGNDVVVDATRTLTGRELFLNQYTDHAITRPLAGLTSIMYMPRSVRPLPEGAGGAAADRPLVRILTGCTEQGWGETDWDQNPMRFDPAADAPGPLGVAAAVERGPAGALDVVIRPTRLVVFGDSDFAANRGLAGANADLFMSALNWLLEREEMIALAPKPYETARLVMTRGRLNLLGWIAMGGIPALVAAAGAIVWLRRRR